jgi:hypothetical protein
MNAVYLLRRLRINRHNTMTIAIRSGTGICFAYCAALPTVSSTGFGTLLVTSSLLAISFTVCAASCLALSISVTISPTLGLGGSGDGWIAATSLRSLIGAPPPS